MASSAYLERYLQNSAAQALTLSDYIYNQRGLPRKNEPLPFFIEMVTSRGENIPLNVDNTIVKGIRLIINPASVSMNFSRIVNRVQTMTAWVEEHWGEELDTMTFQGSTASFVYGARVLNSYELQQKSRTDILRSNFDAAVGLSPIVDRNVENERFIGLTTAKRRDTVGYQEFRLIFSKIMSTNGLEFDNQGFVKDRKLIQMSYDYAVYRGYIESLDITEDASSPYKFVYTLTFKSEKTVFSFLR